MTSKLTSIADEKIEDVIKMARESAKIYGGEWDSALIAESPGNNVHGITSDHIEAVVVKTADDSLHSSWLCDYLESVSPAFVIAALRELQERRKADSEPVATLDVQSRRPDGNKFALVFSSAAHKLPDDVYFLYRHAQPAPVVPVTDTMAYAFHHALTDSPLGDDDVEDIKAGLRAALVNVFNTQPAPQEVHDEK
ncbi:hypothetical protein [Klebsiella variicola]|uniref:hypothetical protein n=1 Tax=Klebsiella variicola TaxID=244366 RepID=UPI001E51AD35|nr:hypothetical protein [Klebsiella variicola]MCE0520215.1 hypothetical protein [Klebsiella variicola]